MGPFSKAVGNKKYLLICTDYFAKWVEAKPLANIRDVDVKRFIWTNIVTRFGVPYVLISDNDLQFNSKAFKNYEPLVGNTNAVEPRIFGPYHAPRSLECAGDGCVSKDKMCHSQLVVRCVDVHLGL